MLAGLLGITSWVVASVSTWLVPVYVTAMVFIFVSPRVEPPEGSRGAAGPSAVITRKLAWGRWSPTAMGMKVSLWMGADRFRIPREN